MSRYTISIEIDEPKSDNQSMIDSIMHDHDFLPTITDCNGYIMFLPAYTYTYTSILSSIDVAEKVFDLLGPLYPAIRILVTKSVGRAWKGLDMFSIENRGVRRRSMTLSQKQG